MTHRELIDQAVSRLEDRRNRDPAEVPDLGPILRLAENLIFTIERDLAADEIRQGALEALARAVDLCASCSRIPDQVTPEDAALQAHRTARFKRRTVSREQKARRAK